MHPAAAATAPQTPRRRHPRDQRKWESERKSNEPPRFFLGAHGTIDKLWASLPKTPLDAETGIKLKQKQLQEIALAAGVPCYILKKGTHPKGWDSREQILAVLKASGINKYGYCTIDDGSFDNVEFDPPEVEESPVRPTSDVGAAMEKLLSPALLRTPSAGRRKSHQTPLSTSSTSDSRRALSLTAALVPPPPRKPLNPVTMDSATLDEWADRFLDGTVALEGLPPAHKEGIIARVPGRLPALTPVLRPPPPRASAQPATQLSPAPPISSSPLASWQSTDRKSDTLNSQFLSTLNQRLSAFAPAPDLLTRPDVPEKAITAAISGQHVNIALFRPKLDHSLPESLPVSISVGGVDGSESSLVSFQTGGRRTTSISSFVDWVSCYLEYERIVVAAVPAAIHMTRPYFKLISALAVINQSAAIDYDNRHRGSPERISWPAGYASRVETLWSDIRADITHRMVTAAQAVSSPPAAPQQSRSRQPRAAPAPAQAEAPRANTCRNWNNNTPCNPANLINAKCKYDHVCSHCGGTHALVDCTTRPPAAARGRGRGRGGAARR